jgi:hypothetical protein
MAGGHDHGHGGHDDHGKKSGGHGGGSKPGFMDRLIERFALPAVIIVLVVGTLSSCVSGLGNVRFSIPVPFADTILDDEIRGCIPPMIAPWPCHEPKRPIPDAGGN